MTEASESRAEETVAQKQANHEQDAKQGRERLKLGHTGDNTRRVSETSQDSPNTQNGESSHPAKNDEAKVGEAKIGTAKTGEAGGKNAA